jgi:hypothetical protein
MYYMHLDRQSEVENQRSVRFYVFRQNALSYSFETHTHSTSFSLEQNQTSQQDLQITYSNDMYYREWTCRRSFGQTEG